MEILWLALAALLVMISIAGIWAGKRRSSRSDVFYLFLFLFFALAAFTLFRITWFAGFVMIPASLLIAIILCKGRKLQMAKDRQKAPEESKDESR